MSHECQALITSTVQLLQFVSNPRINIKTVTTFSRPNYTWVHTLKVGDWLACLLIQQGGIHVILSLVLAGSWLSHVSSREISSTFIALSAAFMASLTTSPLINIQDPFIHAMSLQMMYPFGAKISMFILNRHLNTNRLNYAQARTQNLIARCCQFSHALWAHKITFYKS